MANLEYKQAVLKLVFEAGLVEGKMKTKSKTYRNIQASATADGLETVATTLASLSNSPYIGAEKVETLNLI
ncbi:DUF1659 domain-containing protein [Psychrobacillus vulpis]|uniref:DUF1659 domain-containing protein n=1 Tax=Psychrobacillus vulpis TaxID=2325572 RepID=A0A544TPU6_9BACI|nr:DUF1659 domain-containing protein [Psychrobacillus vulpis]TQR19473.1 DUF1659 domain-containing protein [Psychrobacillus vulpis]